MTGELINKAHSHINNNEWDQAVNCLEQARQKEPDGIHVLGPLAFCYSRLRKYTQAIELYERLCELEPQVSRWPYGLGYQYYDQRQYSKAIEYFDQALEIDPDYMAVLYRKGYALSAIEGKRGKALTVFERCRKTYHALTDGDLEERARKFYADACYQQGKLLLKAGNIQLAGERLSEAVDLKPNEADVHYALGKCYLKTKQFKKAIASLKTSRKLAKAPQHYILDYLGRAHMGDGQFHEALKVYEQMPAYIRNRVYILRNMAAVYVNLEEWNKAEETLQIAVKGEPKNHNGHYQLGLVHEKLGKWSKAAQEFKKAIALRQKHYNVSFPEAEEALKDLLNMHPEASIPPKQKIAKQSTPISASRVGRVKTYLPDKGYGFLEVEGEEADLFFHIKEVEGRDTVEVGEYFEYKIIQGKRGPKGINLKLVQLK